MRLIGGFMSAVSLVEGLDDPVCGLAPLLDAARLVQPGLESVRPLTLAGVTTLAEAGTIWRDQLYLTALAPFLLDQLARARHGKLREMAAADAQFSEVLDETLAESSIAAGRKLVGLAAAMRGDRLLPKLADRAARHEIPCHYLTVFAARCAAFSIDDRTALGASVIREVCGWSIISPAPAVAGFIRSCIDVIPASRFGLRAA